MQVPKDKTPSREQRPDEISTEELIYMAGLHDGKKQERPWVGLTHKEMYDVIRPLCSADEMATWLLEISEDEYLAIEAKLKEKNCG